MEIWEDIKEQSKKKINLKEIEGKKIEENLKTTTKIHILGKVKCYIHETVKQKAKARAKAGLTDLAGKEKQWALFRYRQFITYINSKTNKGKTSSQVSTALVQGDNKVKVAWGLMGHPVAEKLKPGFS